MVLLVANSRMKVQGQLSAATTSAACDICFTSAFIYPNSSEIAKYLEFFFSNKKTSPGQYKRVLDKA